MNTIYSVIDDRAGLIDNIQPGGIVSRTFFRGDRLKAVIFGFDTGQELTEHTSTQAAILQIVQGEASITLGDDKHELKAGSWLHMPPNLKHSVYAKTPLIMLLVMYGTD